MKVILYDNRHVKDYWGTANLEPVKTWMILEDNGTIDGGKVIAEFRHEAHAIKFCQTMDWPYTY